MTRLRLPCLLLLFPALALADDFGDGLAAMRKNAQAESGDFKEAVKTQKKAMALDSKLTAAKEHLKLYQDGKPYHQK